MFEVRFTPTGVKDLEQLPHIVQKRIVAKLRFFASQLNPLIFSKPLVNLPPATHRFRVGDYRIAFFVANNVLYIERLRHRKEIYK